MPFATVLGNPCFIVSYGRQEMHALRERVGSPPFFGGIRVVHRFSFLCCVFCFVCLSPVFCVPNVASFSGNAGTDYPSRSPFFISVFGEISVGLLFSFVVFCFCFDCLRLVSCIPNIASFWIVVFCRFLCSFCVFICFLFAFFLCLVCHILPVVLDCSFLIAPSFFYDVCPVSCLSKVANVSRLSILDLYFGFL